MTIKIIFFTLLLITWILPVVLKTKRSVHMLQLNSYRNERYGKWISQNRPKVFPSLEGLYIVPIVLALLVDSPAVVLGSGGLIFLGIYLYFRNSQQTEKKKLVYTQRVQRLLGTTYIMYGLTAAGAIIAGAYLNLLTALIILILAAVLPYYIIMFANTINRPIEARISQGFVNDAKRLLKASPELKVIGITGSFGKTSVKHFVHAVLSSKYNVLMTPESYNTKLGVTRTINEQLKPYHDIFIAEMGAKQVGDIKEICDIVDHQYGILTAVGEQHLDTFKTLDNIKKTKHEIVETLPEDSGVAILNKDDKNIMSYTPQNPCRKVYYGVEREDVDLHASNIAFSSKGMTFTVTTASGETERFLTRLLGKHNVYNILAALAIGLEMGLKLKDMARAVKQMDPVPHRLELKRSTGNITIIDDSFNSNPVGSKMAVDVLGRMEGYRMLITPGMIELGDKEFDINKEWARYSADKCDFIILVGKKQTLPLQEGLKEAGYPENQFYVASDLQDALRKMHEVAQANTVVLLENDLPDTFNE
ncbi:UDP-N-acetylmuramoyl-tripeptide--D-alanyl-D-alanine ligase [Salipaludibacillus agaradhaerens]|uniref:UDP-N-acetylmuramoyl-tripeptide--D-alanyl-D- alanine ligase n=1 Tax=Salipaludibacillus agaradhaerens TaxID=76935 RepID=UPI000998210F|nr:UDP-N-acetylmuramoyl-tripeptide--D-alanyl-D-alanine ligase [Salipaludibacillus agaradhaerens]